MFTREDLLNCGFDEDVDGITLPLLTMFELNGRPDPDGLYTVEFMGEWDLLFRDVGHLRDFISAFTGDHLTKVLEDES